MIEKRTKSIIITVACSILSVWALYINMTPIPLDACDSMRWIDKAIYFWKKTVKEDSIGYFILLCVAISSFYVIGKKNVSKRLKITSALTAIAFSILYVICQSFLLSDGWGLINENELTWIRTLVLVSGISIMLYYFIIFLYSTVISKLAKSQVLECKRKNEYMFVLLVILLAWLPYMLIFYPANLGPDGLDEIAQVVGNKAGCWTAKTVQFPEDATSILNNHHPIVYTLLLGIAFKFGKWIGDVNVGIFLLALFQAVVLAGMLSYVLQLLRRMEIPNIVYRLVISFFMFWPVIPMYAITLTKDTLFTVTILYLTAMTIEMRIWRDSFWKSKSKAIKLMLCMVAMTLLRNNGVYIVAIMLVVLAIMERKNIKRIGVIFGIPIVLYSILFIRILLPAFNIPNGSPREMLSIPIQQISRYAVEWGIEGFEEDEIDAIDGVFNIQNDITTLQKKYNPTLSDPVKGLYRKDASKEAKKEFFLVWMKLLRRHPGTFINATINNNYPLFSSKYNNGMYYFGVIKKAEVYGIYNTEWSKTARETVRSILQYARSCNLTSWMFSVGYWDYVILLCMIYFIYKKQYHMLIVFAPILINILTCIAGPIIYMRYAFQWIIVVPLLFSVVIYNEKIADI